MITAPTDFENIYETYSPMLLGIALEFSTSKQAAEELVVRTFLKRNNSEFLQMNQKSPCIALIKLMTQTMKEEIEPVHFKNNLKISVFENLPITHKILFEQNGFENYCSDSQITRLEAAKKVRAELLLHR